MSLIYTGGSVMRTASINILYINTGGFPSETACVNQFIQVVLGLGPQISHYRRLLVKNRQ